MSATPDSTNPPAWVRPSAGRRAYWLTDAQHDLIVAALTTAAARVDRDLTHETRPDGANTNTDAGHDEPATAVRRWRELAQTLATTTGDNPPPAVIYQPDAARTWLTGADDGEAKVSDHVSTATETIAACLDGLVQDLAGNRHPQVWSTHSSVREVALWRTSDDDGTDGGAIITIDLIVGAHTVRLASRHQGFDHFVDDAATCGVDAAAEGLAHIADQVNQEIAQFWQAAAVQPPDAWTVLGVWLDSEPVPIGVVAGAHTVHEGDDSEFPEGLWTTSVVAHDALSAQQLAVADMRTESRTAPAPWRSDTLPTEDGRP